MDAKYLTKENNVITLYLWPDLLDTTQNFRKYVEISKINEKHLNKNIIKSISIDNNGKYILFDGDKIYLKDFMYMNPVDLISVVNNSIHNDTFLSPDELLATLMHNDEELNVIYPLYIIKHKVPYLGLLITDTDVNNVVCKFSKNKYDKSRWHYKVTLEPVNESDKLMYASTDIYFSDLWTDIKKGNAKLILA